MFKRLYHIALRECGIMWKNPIYLFCMVIFPIVVVIFFTSLMKEGVPTDMPVGIVDQDHSATSRQLVHKLDAFQTTKVVSHYENIAEARHAIQKNEIYAFLVIPDGTEAGLMASRQPKISFYYSSVSLAAGSLLFRDLKTISTLGGAAAGMAKLSALGKTNDEIMTKATLSKGTKKTISKYDYVVNEIDKILGCWICNHQYQGIIREHQPFIEGSFDLHIWYSHLNESYLLKQQVHYQDAIDLNMKDHQLSQNDQIIVESQYLPRCIHATLENKTMHIEIEKQMSLKIIGDTTILVESKTNDEELEMKINPDFIT